MTRRIFRAILSVSAAVLVVGLFFVMAILHQYFANQLEKELQNEATYLAVAVETGGVLVLDELEHDETERITLIDPTGAVLFETNGDIDVMENHAGRKEFKDALETGEGKDTRRSSTIGKTTTYYAVRLADGNVLRVSSTQYSLETILFALSQPLLWIVILMLVLSGVFASRAAKNIVEPINRLDPEHPETGKSYDEVAPLLHKISRQQKTISRQLAEAKRQQAEFSLITEHMSEGLLVVDAKGNLLSCNSSAVKLLGIADVQMAESVLALNHSELFQQAVESALAGQRHEVVLEFANMSCQITATPVLHGMRPAGAVIFIVDVTEKLQRELLRKQFTANVSHELKTPLTSISGFAEIMHNGLAKPENTKEFAGRIYEEAQRLITLVSDIIKISRLDEGGLPYEEEQVDLYALAEEVLGRLQPAAQREQITLQLEGVHAMVDTISPIAEEIIFNLCDNAIKYNRPGGSVTVRVDKTENQTTVRVKDTGIGIPPAFLQRVFERFFRVDKSHSRKIGGTGLGLSIVKHSAMYLHVDVTVDSVPDEGTEFTLVWHNANPALED